MPILTYCKVCAKASKLFTVVFLVITLSQAVYAKWPELSPKELETQKELIANMKKEPNNALFRFDLAMQLAYTGWVEYAWFQLKQIPKLNPEFQIEHETVLFDAVQADPENAYLHFKIAFAYYFNDKKNLSLAAFLKAHQYAPKQAWIMGFIALVYGEQKKYKEAIRWCKKGLKIEPHATGLHFLLAEGYRKTGNYALLIGEAVHVLNARNREKEFAPPLPK